MSTAFGQTVGLLDEAELWKEALSYRGRRVEYDELRVTSQDVAKQLGNAQGYRRIATVESDRVDDRNSPGGLLSENPWP